MSEQTKNEKTSCCRPLAAAPAASPTPDGAAPTAPVPSVPEVPSVPSNVGEHETLPEIEEDLRSDKRRFSNSDATAIASRIQEARKRQEQAHQKEAQNRHTLEWTLKEILRLSYDIGRDTDIFRIHTRAKQIWDMANLAQKDPPRECDIGTLAEQKARLEAYCASHGKDGEGAYRCEKCSLLYESSCELAWANMPYKERDNKMKNESTAKPKVLVIDDAGFMRSYAQKFLDFCDVEQEYGIPEDETVLAKYDVLIVDGEGIGNSKYKDGIEFCKAYEKQGNNKGLIYHSGLLPDKCDREELEKKGIKSVRKGGFASDLVEAVQEVVLNPSSGKESK